VEGQAVAEEPTDTPEPEPTDTPTPEPEPTETPTPEPEDSSSGDSSTGDTLAQPTKEPAEEAEALALRDEYYVHPSGTFGFRFPVDWEVETEEDNRVTVGSNNPLAKFSVMYMDPGRKLSQADMEELSENMVDLFTDGTGTDGYEVLESEQDEDGVYVQIKFKLSGFDVVADFLFVQQDTVVYIIIFVAADREAMQPTLEAILDTFDTDSSAAKAGGDTPAAAPTATPAPPPPTPTPTPAPAANQFAPPPGGSRIFLENLAGGEYYVDFGDGSGSIKVDPGVKNLYHDVSPGRYTPSFSLFGGATTNLDFEIGPDQSFVIFLDSDGLTIRGGQIYP
jgi:hypothetical protein